MIFSKHSLHELAAQTDEHFDAVRAKANEVIEQLSATSHPADPAAPSYSIPLTNITMGGNFDSYITVQTGSTSRTLILDSGNPMLVMPYYEDIENNDSYTVLGTANEPWGSPAKVVKGPVTIPTSSGNYVLQDVVFYACTGGARTANFGAGCLNPWSASGWNTPNGINVTMQSPLSYGSYTYAEFMYEPVPNPGVTNHSSLVIHNSAPAGYTTMDIIANEPWMSLIPTALSIGDTSTGWPGTLANPIAMIDTGGGPVFLSDPNGDIYNKTWPDSASCPAWSSSSKNCTCVSDSLTLTLKGTAGTPNSFTYTIDTASMPSSVQGLTGVFCESVKYMWGHNGMNVGGVSCLAVDLLIDYTNQQVGLKAKS